MIDITVYSKPNCVQCNATYRALKNAGIDYTVVDVTEDEASYDMIIGLGYLAAPVVIAGETHWSGFQPDKINALRELIAVEA